MVGDGNQRGFRRMVWTEAVLVGRQEMVGREVVVELSFNHTLHDFGYDGDNGYRSEVGGVRWVAVFEDRMNKGMFPGARIVRVDQAGVDDV